MTLSLDAKIEGILYYKGQPVSLKELMHIIKQDEIKIREALDLLRERLNNRGLTLVESNDLIELCTHADLSELITHLQKEELEKPLSKASIETLAIIAYSDGITRSEVDFIRGVNSTFIIRSLEVRGLVEKKSNPEDKRALLYYPSLDFLKSLGQDKVQELPDYVSFQEKILYIKNNQLEAEG